MNAITADYMKILNEVDIDGDGKVMWDPFCGDGEIVRHLLKDFSTIYASDPAGSDFQGAVKADPFTTAPPHDGTVDWIITRVPKDDYVRAAWRFMDVAMEGIIMLSGTSAFFRRRTFSNLVSEAGPATIIVSPLRRKYGKSMYDFPMAAIWYGEFGWDNRPTTLQIVR